MRIQQILEKYAPLISYMLAPAFIYAVGLLSFLSYDEYAPQFNNTFHILFYVLSVFSILILLNFNINRHLFLIVGSIFCYVFINCIKREYGADFNQTIWFNYLIILFPLNLIIFYFCGKFRFISSKSLKIVMMLLLEYGVVEELGKHNINLNFSVYGINIIALALYFVFFAIFLTRSIRTNNLFNYSTLYATIAAVSGFYFASSSSALSSFFFISQLIIFVDLVFTLTYNHFYDEGTGFYSRNSYLIKSKSFPFKYNLGIISIDNYDKLLKTFGYKKQKIVTNLIAEVVQELTSEEEVFRYAQDQFVVLYKDKDNKESFKHLDNIRRIIAGLSFGFSPKEEPIKLTVSCSLAEKKRSDADALEVLMRADKAMRQTLKFTHNVTSKG